MGNFGVGQAIRRVEDQRFLTGTGRYTDDITVPGQVYLYLLRSTHAHADITKLDIGAAKTAPGVLAVLTSADLDAMNIGGLPCEIVPPNADGSMLKAPLRPVLAKGRVRYVGEPIVAVVAATLAQAKDAAELVEIDFNDLPVSVRTAETDKPGKPQLHAGIPRNVLSHWHLGDKAKVEEAFKKAFKVVSIDLINNRMNPTALEPRGAIGEYDAKTDRYTLTQGCQNTHKLKSWLSEKKVLPVEPEQVRVLCPDVGGGFGMRYFLFNEPVMCLVASKAVGKPVKWTADRSESFLADGHGRDQVNHAELALDKDGNFLGIRVSSYGNAGAYMSQFGAMIPTMAGCGMLCGAYRIPAAAVDVKVVFTNTAPVDAYRGAGRPEAAYLVERLVEKAAREMGMSSVELRRRNLIRAEDMPYKTPLGPVYDSGRYEELMDAALKRADIAGLPARKTEAKKRGMLRGAGISYYVEACSGGNSEKPLMRFEKDGRLTIMIGTQNNGQGHETVYAQVAAAAFNIPIEQITVKQGDTDLIPTGFGTGGSRSVPIGGSAIMQNSLKMIEQGKALAADLLEAAAVDIAFEDGKFKIAGTDRSVGLKDVIAASYNDKRAEGAEAGLFSSENYAPSGNTFPNGCHVCEIDIDEATGVIHFVNYTIQDDLGYAMNPLLMEGQIYGGAVQGVGQALYEQAVYDDDGQLVTGSFMDYTMPRADSSPAFDFAYTEVPTPRNALGIKGAGEAGTIGATPAAVNAVLDALAPLGITHLDMPLTPLKIWQAITAAKTKASAA
ncbi:MAG: xanthine dehydrogenase family protein molybdopterin-binding subunit [Rhodospirillaceae bacterium]|nr:xanthine dehydrogenase family protein molybdopterin-binding subunit [Rhodospirillaceae bacterium]